MARISLLLIASICFGALLASGSASWFVRPGLVGLVAMLIGAWLVRRYWQGLRIDGRPGSPERALWHGLAAFGVLLGHLLATIWQLGLPFEMHSLAGHALAVDNWTLVLGAIASYWMARDPEPRRDERDELIRTSGLQAGHRTLLSLLVAIILVFGFAGDTVVGRFNQPMLAHMLIMTVLAQCLAQVVVQLRLYCRDAADERNRQ